MSSKWKDNGVKANIIHDIPNIFTPKWFQTDTHKVENKETGEKKFVFVNYGQTVGEAIAKGQWED